MLSDTTHLETWLIIPLSQTIHILSVAVVMISIGVLNVRLLGFGNSRQSFGRLTTQLTPWIWSGLGILLITGLLQTLAEPSRELLNSTFQLKMALLVIAVAITISYRVTTSKAPNYWDVSPDRRRMARLLASTSLVLWLCILSAGRLIAYFGAFES
jgi:uncharacterized membrane protein